MGVEDSVEAFEEQLKKEVRKETLLLVKEAQLLLDGIAKFREEQNENVNIVKETKRANKEMEMYFKAVMYSMLADPSFVDLIKGEAEKMHDYTFKKWLISRFQKNI